MTTFLGAKKMCFHLEDACNCQNCVEGVLYSVCPPSVVPIWHKNAMGTDNQPNTVLCGWHDRRQD